jgi:tape measure domain-containing protein
MAEDVDLTRLVVSLEANIKGYENQLRRATLIAEREVGQIRNALLRGERDLFSYSAKAKAMQESVSTSLLSMSTKAGAAIGAALSVSKLKEYADGWSDIRNKIIAAGEAASRVDARASQVTDIATRSRSDLGSTADLYSGLRRSTAELGANEAQVQRVTETISKAFTLGGQSAATAAGAITQLNQAFASGALRGDELNSVLEGAPPLARLIAKEFGVSVGKLKELGEEGKLTADRVFQAILNGSKTIDSEFSKTTATVGQSFNVLSASFTRFIGQLDQSTGASATFAQGMIGIAANLDTAAKVAGVAAAALLGVLSPLGGIGAGAAAAATAIALFGDSIRPVAGEIASLADYGRAAFDMISQIGGPAAQGVSNAFSQAAISIAEAMSSASGSVEPVVSAVKTSLNAVIGSFVAAKEIIEATWSTLGKAMAEGVISGVNATIAAVEKMLQKVISGINALLDGVNAIGGNVGITLGKIGDVNLGRVESAYAGAGKAAGEAYGNAFGAVSRDYIGGAMASADGALQAIRNRSNEIARNRALQSFKAGEAASYNTTNDGRLDNPLKRTTPKGDDGGGGGGAKKDTGNEFTRAVDGVGQRIRAYEQEAAAIGKSAFEASKAKQEFDLLEAAKKAGIPVTDELRSRIGLLADAYATAKTQTESLKEAQQGQQELLRTVGGSLTGYLSDVFSGGQNAERALENLRKKLLDLVLQAAIMGDGPLGKMLGLNGQNGQVGGFLGSIFKGLSGLTGGFASGSGPYSYGAGGYTGAGPFLTAPAAHGGAIVPYFSMTRAVDPAVFNGAPRFHTGLKPNEFAAILEEGEAVLTQRHQAGISALASKAANNMVNVQAGGVTVNNYGSSKVEASQDGSGRTVVDVMDAINSRGVAQGMKGRGAFGDVLPSDVRAQRRIG